MNIPNTINPTGGVKAMTLVKIEEAPVKLENYEAIVVLWRAAPNNYEVHLVRPHTQDKHIKGKLIARKGDPRYPSSSEWGRYGWTFKTEEAGRTWLQTLVNNQNAK